MFSIWGTTGEATRRLTGVLTPVPFPSDILSGPWLTNRRGDVLMVDHVGDDGALLIEAGGASVPADLTLARDLVGGQVVSALGEDGAAVVAWTAEHADRGTRSSTVWARVRPAGAPFGPVVALPNPGAVGELDADIAPDGRAEIVHSFDVGDDRESLVHTSIAPDGKAASPVTLATADAPVFLLQVVRGRVIYAAGGDRRATVITGAVRQRLARDSAFRVTAHPLADGGVLLTYTNGRDVHVSRAAPGAPFGPPQRLAHGPPNTLASRVEIASGPDGALLVAWQERIDPGCVRDWCFDRVVAAAAAPGGPFGPPQVVSPLGTRANDLVAALSDDGRRLVAWQGTDADASAPEVLTMALGDATADPPMASDRRTPRLRVLASAIRGRNLRLRVRSDERAAVRVFVGETSLGRAFVVPARRAKTAVLPLSRYQFANRRSVVIAVADAAGNARVLRP